MVIEFQLNYLKDGATVISPPLYDKLKTLLWKKKKKRNLSWYNIISREDIFIDVGVDIILKVLTV